MIRSHCWRILSRSTKHDRPAFVEDLCIYFLIIVNTVLAGVVSIPSVRDSATFYSFYEYATTISIVIFSFEFILKLWSCPEADEYKGAIKGRLKFIYSIFSVVDILVIGAFFRYGPEANLIFLHLIRIPKLAVYLGGEDDLFSPAKILKKSFINKKEELLITIIYSLTLLLFCSFLIFFIEQRAQPEVFRDIAFSLSWVFSVLTGSPLVDFSPVTFLGKLLHVVMIVLGVVVVGLPVGILTGSFISEIDDIKKIKNLKVDSDLLIGAFQFEQKINIRSLVAKLNLPSDRKLLDLDLAMARLEMSEDQIIRACRYSDKLRIRAQKQNISSLYEDNLVIECFPANESFGCFLNRGSKLHIISTQSAGDPGIGHFSRVVANACNANYYSNEYFSSANFNESTQFNFAKNTAYHSSDHWRPEAFDRWNQVLQDTVRAGDTVIYLTVCSAERIPGYHLLFGGKRGDSGFQSVVKPTFEPISQLELFFNKISDSLKMVDMKAVTHEEFGNNNPNHLTQVIRSTIKANVLSLNVNHRIIQALPLDQYYRLISDLRIAILSHLHPQEFN